MLYDRIGAGYATRRRADPRLAAAIRAALGAAPSVVNVGAGTGSYEPPDLQVVSVEPSPVMLAQRPAGVAAAVRAAAEALPFADGAFDAALAVLTIHHWTDLLAGLRECRRVAADRVVIATWDPSSEGFWLTQDYVPAVLASDRRRYPPLETLEQALGPLDVQPLPIPADCADGFLGAYWRRPAAYLDPAVRAGMSALSGTPGVEPGLVRLGEDLASGRWLLRYGGLLELDALDAGYRLVVARRRAPLGGRPGQRSR